MQRVEEGYGGNQVWDTELQNILLYILTFRFNQNQLTEIETWLKYKSIKDLLNIIVLCESPKTGFVS